MTIRKLLSLLFAAVAAVVLVPETASAQCWRCDYCLWGPNDSPDAMSCHGTIIVGPVLGFTNCHEIARCVCRMRIQDLGICGIGENGETAAVESEQLKRTLAAIKAGRSISADGPFVYLRQGSDYVVRRRCDAEEIGRVAVADVQPVPVVGAG